MNLLVGRRTRCVARGQNLIKNALGQCHHTLLLRLHLQPILVSLCVLILVFLHIKTIFTAKILIIALNRPTNQQKKMKQIGRCSTSTVAADVVIG